MNNITRFFTSICMTAASFDCYCVNSFDFFDTLAGRFRFSPDSPFVLMSEALNQPEWPGQRKTAESRSTGSLDSIYGYLTWSRQTTPEEAAKLRALEVSIEIGNLFPIQDNIAKVQKGDWIVSDTYYSEAELRQMIRAIGLDDDTLMVFASPGGKRNGSFWSKFAATYGIEHHLGDNWVADVKQPKAFGISAEHYRDGELNRRERSLASLGLNQLSAFLRMLRLNRPSTISSEVWFGIDWDLILSALVDSNGDLSVESLDLNHSQLPPVVSTALVNLIIKSQQNYCYLERDISNLKTLKILPERTL